MRRIWRFNPWVKHDPKMPGARLLYLAPARHGVQDGHAPGHVFDEPVPRMGRSTTTWYSFSWWFRALRILLTTSPSDVRKISPSLGLSRRPTGKMRRAWSDRVNDVVPLPFSGRSCTRCPRACGRRCTRGPLPWSAAPPPLAIHFHNVARHHLASPARERRRSA